jgi:biotin transport system substrate-specific component
LSTHSRSSGVATRARRSVGASMFAWSPVLLPGAARLLGPTGGFLIGFAVSGAIAAFAAERGLLRTWGGAIAMLTVAHLSVFVPGIGGLAAFLSLVKSMNLSTALTTAFFSGFVPFIAGTVLKTGLAVLTVRAADRR